MGRLKRLDNMSLYNEGLEKVKYKCGKCGHRVVIPFWEDKQICSWCRNYVFSSKEAEFKYRMKERLAK